MPDYYSREPMDYVRVALAIETLAYHNKNYLDSTLATSNARISEEVQALLIEAIKAEGHRVGEGEKDG